MNDTVAPNAKRAKAFYANCKLSRANANGEAEQSRAEQSRARAVPASSTAKKLRASKRGQELAQGGTRAA
jgi:hypothetical protein